MGSLRSLVDQASGFAQVLFDPSDVMMPHFVAEAANGEITLAALAMSGPDLDRMRQLLALKFAADGFTRWVFFSEAWSAQAKVGERRVEPIDHPERMEVVMFDGFDRPGNRHLRASRQILRQPDGARLLPLVIATGQVFDVPSARSRERSSSGAAA